MNTPRYSFRSRQQGIATVLAVVFLVTAVIFALSQTLSITGSNSIDNKQQLDSTATFFLAESGVERGLATLRLASLNGSYTNATCTNMALAPAYSLGAGTYRYTAAVSTPATCGGVGSPTCTNCTVTVQGTVGSASRVIRAGLATTITNGVEGFGSQFTLKLKANFANTFAFNHLAFNPPTNWGTGGTIGTCLSGSTGAITTNCIESWHVPGTERNNTGSQGVYAQVPNAGNYSITGNFTLGNPPAPVSLNYVLVGVIMRPLNPDSGGRINHTGSYGRAMVCGSAATVPRTTALTADCSSNDYQRGYLPPNWTCNPDGGTTANWSNAGTSNTLVIGFGGKPYSGDSTARTSRLTAIGLNGQQFPRQVEMVGNQTVAGLTPTRAELQYSQLWYAYNKDYYSTANANIGATIVGTIGANFTGATGGVVRGCIGSTTSCGGLDDTTPSCSGIGNILRVCSVSGTGRYGELRVYDTLSSNDEGTDVRTTPATTITEFGPDTTGGIGTYTVIGNQQLVSARNITARSNILRVSAVSSGRLTAGDVITSGISGSPTIQPFSTTGTTGTVLIGVYVLNAQVNPVNTSSMQASSNVLRLAAATCSGSLAIGDSVISGSSGNGTNYGTLSALLSGTAGQSGATYTLTGSRNYVSTAATTCSPSSNINMHTNTATATVTLSSGTTAPLPGTALGVYSGTGQFIPDSVTGSISGTTLTVTAATATTLRVGDALFGARILPNTTITAFGTGSGGLGTYTITPSQTAASGTIMARAAVLASPTPTATSFTMSRLPDTALNNARLCGGVCPFLLQGVTPANATIPVGRFDLTGIIDFDDWSSGFACLSGVDPASILNSVQVVPPSRASWSEPPQ